MRFQTDYRAVGLPDVHLSPKERHFHPAYKVAREYVLDIKPEILVYMGDMGEFESLSNWNKKKPLIAEGCRYDKDVEAVRDELARYRYLLPNTRMIYIIGNHERRARWYVEKNPAMQGFMDIERDLRLADYNIEVVPFNEYIEIGELAWAHGWFYNKYHANKTLTEFSGNILYCHVHHFQQETRNVHFGKKQQVAQSIGCLTSRYPDYKSDRPTRFQNGFVTVEYRNNGQFNINPHLIYNGTFSYGGFTWSS